MPDSSPWLAKSRALPPVVSELKGRAALTHLKTRHGVLPFESFLISCSGRPCAAHCLFGNRVSNMLRHTSCVRVLREGACPLIDLLFIDTNSWAVNQTLGSKRLLQGETKGTWNHGALFRMPAAQRLPIHLGPSTNLVWRPQPVSNGGVGSAIESRSQEPLGGTLFPSGQKSCPKGKWSSKTLLSASMIVGGRVRTQNVRIVFRSSEPRRAEASRQGLHAASAPNLQLHLPVLVLHVQHLPTFWFVGQCFFPVFPGAKRKACRGNRFRRFSPDSKVSWFIFRPMDSSMPRTSIQSVRPLDRFGAGKMPLAGAGKQGASYFLRFQLPSPEV